MKKKRKKVDFNSYFENIYGERWQTLRDAMAENPTHFTLEQGLKTPYYLDEASVIAARELNAQPGDTILDMCAAPGGKSLVLALALQGQGRLIVNDRSSSRRGRLQKVIHDHLPEDFRSIITVTSHDATKWGLYEQNLYDKILLDAPCSSERHLIHSPEHLKNWTPARTKQLSIQGFAMLAAALDAVKNGGIIVYSTCTISPLENDEVIKKLTKKRKGRFSIKKPGITVGEATEYGTIILPDKNKGMGPIYFSIIAKNHDVVD